MLSKPKKRKTKFLNHTIDTIKSYDYLIQFIHGVLLTLAFHPFDIFLVIPITFSGFIWCLQRECQTAKRTKRTFFILGFQHTFIFFFAHFLTSLYWLANPLTLEIKRYWLFLPLAVVILPTILALFYAVFGGLICSHYMLKVIVNNKSSKSHVKVCTSALFAICFFIAEIMRANLILPFPWNLLGYATGYSLSLMQLASITGVYGLSLLLYFVGTIPHSKNFLAISAMTLLVVILTIHGKMRLNNMSNFSKKKLVALYIIQPNTAHHYNQYEKKLAALAKTKNLIHNSLSNSLKHTQQYNFNLVVLPESGLPFTINKYQNKIFDNFLSSHGTNSFLVAGLDRYDSTLGSHYNSMVFMNNLGEIVDSYDKITLAPFGEYIPTTALKYIMKPIVGDSYGFAPGSKTRNIILYSDAANNMQTQLVITPMICFESIFTAQHLSNADLIVNITNDSWFGNTIGPYQHLAMTRMRAIEYGLPLVRAAKTGISAVYNSHGKLLQQINLNEEGAIIIDMPEQKIETTYMKIVKFFKE